jgi:lactate dehydrogenase-like 2-hydroxyacid dehydrogenase
MKLPLILVPSPPPKIVLDALQDRFDLLLPANKAELEAVVADRGSEIRAVANPGESVFGADLMDRLPQLGLIAHFGVGYETVDAAEAARRGIIVTNVAGSNDDEVADTAMGLLLMAARELGAAQDYLRNGRWTEGPYPLTRFSLMGRHMGLLGMGNIGQAIARRAEAFGIEVSYHARHDHALGYRYYPSLHTMAADVDILVVAAPGGASTRHLVDGEVMAALGPDGVLINVARGTVVDERALVSALDEGSLGAAGLDVYEDEPNVPLGLLAAKNAVLLPHVGSASVPTRQQMAELGVENLQSWFRNGTVLTPVNEAADIAAVST